MSELDQAQKTILHWFSALSEIPRKSGNEGRIRAWLVRWALDHGCTSRVDGAGNVLIFVPGTPGYERSPTVVLQGHMDMVCEKRKGSTHDFSNDPIRLVYDGDWLRAEDTTLGADNGIAIAMALAVVDGGFAHPPLELLFTVDEETGLTGAQSLEPGFIQGKVLLNLDSEDEGVFTVGCAGGKDTALTVPVETSAVPDGYALRKVVAGGMKGGHSGVDIHHQRANAIRVLFRALNLVAQEVPELRVAWCEAGTAHNAIPRDAEAVVALPSPNADRATAICADLAETLRQEHARTDPDIKLAIEAAAAGPATATTPEGTRRLVDLVLAVPHGVHAMSSEIPGLVETSNNLARISFEAGEARIQTSQRSSSMARLRLLTDTVEAVGRLAGGSARSGNGYPSWKPNMASPLLARCTAVYEGLFGKKPVVEIIHAGLECGIIGARYPGMDMISFGPTIRNPHSPDEKLHLPSVGLVWRFLVELLGTLK